MYEDECLDQMYEDRYDLGDDDRDYDPEPGDVDELQENNDFAHDDDPRQWDCDEEPIDGVGFANEGSALRAASRDNPRNCPCPTCERQNVLTPLDVARGYQCDCCANEAERGGY